MTELREIFGALKATGLCQTQTDFSRNWLGRSAHYMSQIGGDPRRASLTSLHLLVALLDAATMKAHADNNLADHRKLRAAYVLARTVLSGVFELRHVPPMYRVTAA